VVSDVGDHGSKVEAFNTHLQTMAGDANNVSPDTLLLTIGQMTCANADLQQRLSRLEKQIAAQATELKTYNSEARTDSLTGLANRRAFDDELQRRFAEWQRRRTPFAVMMLDVDNFKSINDTYGHQAGDEALRQLGNVITSNTRQMDFRCRYGGDEFVVIFPDTGKQETRTVADRIRKAVEKAKIQFGTESVPLTCSVGVARVTTQDDVVKLIRRADEAPSRSKDEGRNSGYWPDVKECLPLSADSAKAHGDATANVLDSLVDRTAFLDALKRRLPESQRFGIPLSIIHLGVANYKSLGESYGDAAARSMLSAVATFTQTALRQIDLLARLDNGQFAILLPGSTSNEANQIAKRLHVSAANCDARINNERVHLVVTHGIAEFRPNDTAEAMLSRASQAAGTERPVAEAVIS
jgi:diguanylate cyclase